MEPADDKNKDYSYVAYKMKHKSMKFEDGNGIALKLITLLNHLLLWQLFLVLLTKLKMDGQSTFGILYITNADWATNYLGLLSENVCKMKNGVEIHQFAFVKVYFVYNSRHYVIYI